MWVCLSPSPLAPSLPSCSQVGTAAEGGCQFSAKRAGVGPALPAFETRRSHPWQFAHSSSGQARCAGLGPVAAGLVAAAAAWTRPGPRCKPRRTRASFGGGTALNAGSRGLHASASAALPEISPSEPLASPFPLASFEQQGLPASARFLWWEHSRSHGRRQPGQLRSGLHALDLEGGWLEVASPATYSSFMQERRGILMNQRTAALVDDGASRGAQAELLRLITAHLTRTNPSRFAYDGRTFESLHEGLAWRVEDFADAPLLLAGQLVQEDLCLMRGESLLEGDPSVQYIFASGVVMDSFDPVSKHLLPMSGLHGPVPGYASDLQASMNRVFDSLRRPLWRANFSFYLWEYEDEGDGGAELTPDEVIEQVYLKVEYETIRRLPEHSDYIVFTIRAHMDPLASLGATPLACGALAAEIRHMPGSLLEYKGLGDAALRGTVLSFLDSASGQGK